jgi:nitrite reductase (NO-forming)
MFLPAETRHGIWLPLHLALAGGATTAIAAVLPFFTSSLLGAAPAPVPIRALAIGLVAASAAAVVIGVSSRAGVSARSNATLLSLAPAGGLAFVAAVLVLSWAAFWPIRGSAGRRHTIVLVSYAAAIVDVAIGAMLATLYLGGYSPVVAGWARLMPAHAWLNLLGFMPLVVAGTLIHLYPTVLGTRIPTGDTVPGHLARLVASCLVVGPIFVATGYWLQGDPLARMGAGIELVGAAALVACGLAMWRSRGHWTTDSEWHLAIVGHLSAAIGWLTVGVGLAAWLTLGAGADPAGWSIEVLIAPLGLGCVAQAIVGSWTHLVPSIGPGDAAIHARQRLLFARAARTRLAAFQVATLALLLSLSLDVGWLTFAGTLLAAVAGVGTLGLLLLALAEARHWFGAAFRDGAQRL